MNLSMADERVNEVLDYWFSDIGNGFELGDQNRLWYTGGEAIDNAIKQRFGPLLEEALTGKLDGWAVTAKGALALIVLLDQFTRNIYRGTAKAFAGDSHAVSLVERGLSKGFDQQLTYLQRSFFYMPLEHSECEQHQMLCVKLFEALVADVPPEGKRVIQSSLDYALKHAGIIQQFGRFPHRNDALGRPSTEQEKLYLDSGGDRFGQ